MDTRSRRGFLSACGSAMALGALGGGAGLGAALLPGAAQAQASGIGGSGVPRVEHRHGIVMVKAGDPQHRRVAMTFDDGPHPSLTPRLLDMLRVRRVRATFYVIGSLVRAHPQLVRRMVDEGHELGNHTWGHPFLSRHGAARVLSELDRTAQIIWETVGHVPVTMRPPYGAITERQSRMIHAERNMPTVMWSVDPQDWRRPGSGVVASRIVQGADNGSIILAHDIHAPTVNAMPAALDGLIARGFRFVPMSTMLGWEPWGPRPSPRLHRTAG